MTYLHPSLEPILRDSMGVILYQEQVMRIAIEVAGFSPGDSDGFRRAMGTWRSSAEMEKLHARFVDGCVRVAGMPRVDAEELYRGVAGFASFGFAKSHAAAFARTAYESAFLKLFYPAQFLVGLVNAQPMGFYPVEVLVNDAKRHGVPVLPVDVNASFHRTTTEWAGRPGWALAGTAGDDGRHDGDPGEPLPGDAGIDARPRPVRSSACVVPASAARERWSAEGAVGWGVRLGLHLVKGIGEEHAAHLDAERSRGPYTSLPDVVERTGLPEEVLERLIRAGALDSLGRPRRELLWQLREVARPAKGAPRGGGRVAGRPLDLRLPATPAPDLPPVTELERLGDSYAILSLDARRQVVGLFRPALGRVGAVTNAALAERRPGPVRDRRTGRDPPAPDDREGDRLPRARGRDRDGQCHALARHVVAPAGRGAAERPPRGRREPAAGIERRERGGPRDQAPRRGGPSRRRSRRTRRRAPHGPSRHAPAGLMAGRSSFRRPAHRPPARPAVGQRRLAFAGACRAGLDIARNRR